MNPLLRADVVPTDLAFAQGDNMRNPHLAAMFVAIFAVGNLLSIGNVYCADIQPLPDSVTTAWEDAGASVEYYTDSGLPRFQWLNRSDGWVEKLKQLPSPGRPFGVSILGGELTPDALEQIGKLKQLRQVDLSGAKFPEEGLKALSNLSLTLLKLDSTPVSDVGLAHITSQTRLVKLDLANTNVTDEGLKSLAALSSLEELKLNGNYDVTGAGMKHLAGLSNLKHLVLARTKVADAGLQQIAGLQKLQDLDLGATPVTDAGLRYLTKMPKLGSLDLPSGISDVGLTHLATLKTLRSLRVASGAKVTGKGLATFPQLESLDVSLHETFGDEDLEVVAQLTELQHLGLSATKVTDAGLAHLPGLKKLERLDLDNTKITDEGLKQLVGLQNLRSLNLGATQVTDTGAELLKQLDSLKQLGLFSTKVTAAKKREMYFFLQARN